MNQRKFLFVLTAWLGAAALATSLAVAAPVAQNPVPTLVPPTLVPTVEPALLDALPSESAIARIQREGRVRVGILFNEPGFGELSLRTDENGGLIITGFDADLARSLAETWGVEVEFVQVTRQTAVDVLASGRVELLIAAQPHLRELNERIEFSHAYYPAVQAMLVREDDPAFSLAGLAGRRVGIVLGTRGYEAATDYFRRAGHDVTLVSYYTLDAALAALSAGEVDGVVENRLRLARAIAEPGILRLLDEPVQPEPYAIGIRRQDVNLRNLVNRTLHYLLRSGRLNEIHRANFAGVDYPTGTLIAWNGTGDEAPSLSQYNFDLPFPVQYVVPRLQGQRVVRVAGIRDLPNDAPESERRLDAVHRTLVNAMAERWGVSVVYVPDNGQSPIDLVASGAADFAIGVEPDWNAADRVDFTNYYLMHGLQLLYETRERINGFGDLRGKAVGIFASEPSTAERLRAEAERARAIIDNVYTIAREGDVAYAILAATDINLAAVFGDSMKLIAHLEANPDELSLLSNADGRAVWFDRHYLVMAVPRNDPDFRLLVEYTLQELVRDDTLGRTIQPLIRPQDMPLFEVWPGPSTYLGFSLARG
ncbi:MAG: transporter substrate-binding domain-containing protein [Aggregatilineales bacterium]